MNKVFFYGKNAQPFAAGHEETAQKLKAAFIAYLGEERANSICSAIDAADYVYFDLSLKYPSGPFKFATKIANKFRYFKPIFKQNDFVKYLLTDLKKVDPFCVEEEIDSARKLMLTSNYQGESYCEVQVEPQTGALFCCLYMPADSFNKLYLHEVLHAVSFRQVRSQAEQPGWEIKAGLDSYDTNLDILNELFTEYMTNNMDKMMQAKGMPLIGDSHNIINAYDILLNLVSPFFKQHEKAFMNAYFGADLSPLEKVTSMGNLERLNSALQPLFEKASQHFGVVQAYINKHLAEAKDLGPAIEEKCRKIYSDKLNEFRNPTKVDKDLNKLVDELEGALEACMRQKDHGPGNMAK